MEVGGEGGGEVDYWDVAVEENEGGESGNGGEDGGGEVEVGGAAGEAEGEEVAEWGGGVAGKLCARIVSGWDVEELKGS